MAFKQRIAVLFGAAALIFFTTQSFAQGNYNRTVLLSPSTFLMGEDGNDALGDGTLAKPFRNPQAVKDFLAAKFDLNDQPVTIQHIAKPNSYCVTGNINDITFYGGLQITGRLFGQGGTFPPLVVGKINGVEKPPFLVGTQKPLILRGDPACPRNAYIYPEVGGRSAIGMTEFASLRVDGFGMNSNRSDDNCVVALQSFLDLANIMFGWCAAIGQLPYYTNPIAAGYHMLLMVSGNMEVNGSGQIFMQCAGKSYCYFNNNGDPTHPIVVTFTGGANQTFGYSILQAEDSQIYAKGVVWAGNQVVGKKAELANGGILYLGNGNPFGEGGPVAQCNDSILKGTQPIRRDDTSRCW